MSDPCRHCGYVPFAPGADWGHHDGARGPETCHHVEGERYCDSCSTLWCREGNDSTHDYELVGDPPRYSGGPSHEDCPECAATDVPPARQPLPDDVFAATKEGRS